MQLAVAVGADDVTLGDFVEDGLSTEATLNALAQDELLLLWVAMVKVETRRVRLRTACASQA
jgi:hypothetical protein